MAALTGPPPSAPTEGAGDSAVRAKAAQLLRARGARSAEVLAALEAALEDPERAPRVAAAVALLDNEPSHERAADVLSRELSEAPSWTKIYALREVRTLGGKARSVAAAVEAAARDPSPEVVEHARLVLEALDPCTSSGIRSAR